MQATIETTRLAEAIAALVQAPARPSARLESVVQAYLEAQAPHVGAEHHRFTQRKIRDLLGALQATARAAGRRLELVGDLEAGQVSAWMRARLDQGMASATVRGHVAALKTALAWAVEQEIIERSPLGKLRLPAIGRARQTRPRGRPDSEQIAALIGAASAQDHAAADGIPQLPLLWTMIRTGIRRGEAIAARRGDYDRRARVLRIRAESAKTKRGRVLPLEDEDCAAIDGAIAATDRLLGRQLDTAPLFRSRRGARLQPRNVSRWMDGLLRAAGVPKRNAAGEAICLHSLRHAAADSLAATNLRAAQLLLGHTTSRTTEGYLHSTDADYLRAAIQGLPRPDVQNLLATGVPGLAVEAQVSTGGGGQKPPRRVVGMGERGDLNPRPREPQSGDGLPASGQQNAQTKPEQLAVEIQVQWLREGQEILLPTVEALRALLLAQEPLATLLRRGAVRIKGVARG